MKSTLCARWAGVIVVWGLLAAPIVHADPGPLVDAAWLRQAVAAGDVLVLDTQPRKLFDAGHIGGAIHVDVFAYAPDGADAPAMQRRIQSWGISPDARVVIYDQGGSYLAPRLFYELLYRGTHSSGCTCLTAGSHSGVHRVARSHKRPLRRGRLVVLPLGKSQMCEPIFRRC